MTPLMPGQIRVVILQGAPGAGKSTWIAANVPSTAVVVSADHYFMRDGEYRFDASKLGEAHAQCMRRFVEEITDATAFLVVDNTSPRVSDLSPYYSVARAFGAEVTIVRVLCDPDLAAQRNTHGVPIEAVRRIAASLEDPPPFWACKLVTVRS